MRYLKKAFITSLMVLLFSSYLIAEEQPSNFRVRGTLIDSIRNEAVEFATVSIIPKESDKALKYALSDSKGKFEILSLAAGEYSLKAEFMGFHPVEIEIKLGERRVLDLGNINMMEQINVLESVVVSAVGNPIIVKKDTIEYNASSYKTTDNDMLEELLKKLPGIEIDSDGKITANGKSIDKIMVDGKTFFLNDPTLATKNLPANIIEKVRVVDRKSEQARFTGIDDGNEETVIDLSIKPGMMNGWFGNATAGYGTEERYQAAGMVGHFTKTSQLSLIANGNNTNNRAFTDMAGGMMGGMRGGGMRGGMGGGMRGGIRIGGQSFNFGGEGITTSWMGGVNANQEFKDGKIKLGGNYFYGSSDKVASGRRERETFLRDSSFFNRDTSWKQTLSENHRVALEFEWDISERSSILFRPNVSLGYGSFNERNAFSTDGATGSKINDGYNSSMGDSRSKSLGGDFLYRQRLGKPGRTFSVRVDYSLSDNELDGWNDSKTTTYKEGVVNGDPNVIDQQYEQISRSYQIGGRASYTEPLGRNFFMELAYNYNFSLSNSEKNSFDYNSLTGNYDLKDEEYSNSFKNTFINQRAELNLRKNEEKYSYTVGFNVQPSYTESIGGVEDISQNVVNYSPSALFDYRFTETSSLRLRYRGSTNQPSISQLQPVPDNSNPLYIPLGNPDLLPEFNHSLWVDFRDTKRETFRTVTVRLGANYTMDKIINRNWYDEGGVQYSQPLNENGVSSLFANFMFNSPIKRSKFYLFSATRFSINNGINYTNDMRNETVSISPSQMLRLTYRGESLEASVGGRASYSHSWYSIENNVRPATWNNSISLNANWTLPAGLNITSDFDYRFYIGYGEGMNDPSAVWNGQISKLLFKNQGTLALKVYDILKQSRSLYRNTTDNYIEDIENNTLQQYFMLSFTFRFGSFGSEQRGMRRVGPGRMMHGRRP